MNPLIAFIHHAAAFTLVAALVAEHALFSPRLELAQARRLVRLDAVYGAMAGLLLAVGLVRVFFFEKGAAYYFGNPYFLAKLALFLAAGLLSIYPTMVYLSWRPALRAGKAPELNPVAARRIPHLIRLQLAAIAGAIFCAPFMAKGFA